MSENEKTTEAERVKFFWEEEELQPTKSAEEQTEEIKQTIESFKGASTYMPTFSGDTESFSEGSTYTGSFTVDMDTEKVVQFLGNSKPSHTYHNCRVSTTATADLPGEPAELHECSWCDGEVDTDDEASIEREDEWYCSVNCLNEEMNG